MATLPTLIQNGLLVHVTVPLDQGELAERSIYGCAEFIRWLNHDLPHLESGRLRAADTPQEQLDNIMYRWIAGKPVIYDRMFKDLMPMQDEVWEMKTVDIRVFGWMYRPRIFIAAFADYADLYKGKVRKVSYQDAKRKVMTARDRLDLDEPKFAGGKFDDLVRV
jgi:hypothetical protein